MLHFVLAQLVQVGTFRSIDKDDSETTLFESQLDKLWKGERL